MHEGFLSDEGYRTVTRSGWRVVAVLFAALVITSGAGLASNGAGSTQSGSSTGEIPLDLVEVPRDSVLVDIDVQPDGTGIVQVEIRTVLDDESTRQAFEDERERIDDDQLAVAGAFAEGMQDVARIAEQDLDREMAVRNATVSTGVLEVPNRMGVVVFRFHWEGFAAVEPGGRMTAGPALSAIPLEEDTTLQLRWPEDYEGTGVSPAPHDRENGQVTWEGPKEFGSGQPQVRLQPTGLPRLTHGVPNWLFFAGGTLLVLGAVGVIRWRSRRRDDRVERGRDDGGKHERDDGRPGMVLRETPAAEEEVSATEGVPATREIGDAAASPAEELLSDEERVLGLVERNGGRMKQQGVVETMGWSETKTSEVVGRLRDDAKLEVYRIGRENVLALPGEMDV